MNRKSMFLQVRLLACVFFLITWINAGAQQNNSLYFFDRVPQSMWLNPAHQPASSVFIGLPIISSIEVNGGNTIANFNDAFTYNSKTDSLQPFYSTPSLMQKFLDKLPKTNMVFADAQTDLASLGFRVNRSYFSFSISEKLSVAGNIPKDMFRFANELIDVGKSYDFSGFGLRANYYREYAFGYSQQISDKLNFGVRAKMLFGKANITTQNSEFRLYDATLDSIKTSSAVSVNASIPYLKVYTDAAGKIDSTDFADPGNARNLMDNLFMLNKNRGFAFDIGMQYYLSDKLTLSASILDLGYINWKKNVYNFNENGDFNFKGIQFGFNDTADYIKAFTDTLQSAYNAQTTSDAYLTALSPKLYLGFCYSPVRQIKLSVLSRSEYIFRKIRQQYTTSLTLYPAQFLGFTFSYTIADKVYDNLGFGMVLRSGFFQMYLMSERIPLTYDKVKNSSVPYVPVYMKNANFRFGINLVFGSNPRRKLMKDKPFLE